MSTPEAAAAGRDSLSPPKLARPALGLVVALAVTFAAAGIGSVLTTPALEPWYASLAKPSWNPPNWVFAPVWTVLYTLMAVAAWLVWLDGGRRARPALELFGLQLVLNVGWSAAFFALRSPGAGLVLIVALWAAIAITAVAFGKVNRNAAWLLAPYLGWVSFAAALNGAIWLLS